MADVCGGGGPWKNTDAGVVHAALWLANRGIDIAGLSDDEVLSTYRGETHPILPDVYGIGDQPISIWSQGERK